MRVDQLIHLATRRAAPYSQAVNCQLCERDAGGGGAENYLRIKFGDEISYQKEASLADRPAQYKERRR
jgi:hypothetical protein